MMCSYQLSAQLIDYCIIAYSKNVYRGGTANAVDFKIEGARGNTGWFKVDGARKKGEETVFSVTKEDVGKISKLHIDLHYNLADRWYLEWVKIYRDCKCTNKNKSGGYYVFRPNEYIGSARKTYTPTESKGPDLTINADGLPESNSITTVVVNYMNNLDGTVQQQAMNLTETWSSVQRVGYSESNSTAVGAAFSLNYTSPPTPAGTFGASASADYKTIMTEARESSSEHISGSTYEWKYAAAPEKFTFRKGKFTIPHDYQRYKYGDKMFYVRKLGAQIVQKGQESILTIPKINEEGTIVPILWNEIERDYLMYIPYDEQIDILTLKQDWLRKGYVYEIGKEISLNWNERQATYKNISINGSGKNDVVVLPGQDIALSFDFEIAPTGKNGYCPGCIMQFYVGMKDNFSECFTNQQFRTPSFGKKEGQKTLSFKAPSEIGIYYITQAVSLKRSCQASPSRHSVNPRNAIAIIKVESLTESLIPTPVITEWSKRKMTYDNISLNGSGKNVARVRAGSKIQLNFSWKMESTGSEGEYCPGCIIQYYMGMKGVVSQCFFNSVFNSNSSLSKNNANMEFTAPSQKGFYYITPARSLKRQCQEDPNRHPSSIKQAIAIVEVI